MFAMFSTLQIIAFVLGLLAVVGALVALTYISPKSKNKKIVDAVILITCLVVLSSIVMFFERSELSRSVIDPIVMGLDGLDEPYASIGKLCGVILIQFGVVAVVAGGGWLLYLFFLLQHREDNGRDLSWTEHCIWRDEK